MRRGDVFIAATGHGLGGKPRPVLIIQADSFIDAPIIMIAPLIDVNHAVAPIRPIIAPSEGNGLIKPSAVAADTLIAIRKRQFGPRVGILSAEELIRVDSALMLVLGLTR